MILILIQLTYKYNDNHLIRKDFILSKASNIRRSENSEENSIMFCMPQSELF